MCARTYSMCIHVVQCGIEETHIVLPLCTVMQALILTEATEAIGLMPCRVGQHALQKNCTVTTNLASMPLYNFSDLASKGLPPFFLRSWPAFLYEC